MDEQKQNGMPQGGLSWSTPGQQPQRPDPTVPSSPKPMTQPSTSAHAPGNKNKIIWAFIAGAVVCALVVWGISANKSGKTATTGSQDNSLAYTLPSTASSNTGPGSTVNTAVAPGAAITSDTTGSLVILSPQDAGFEVSVTKAAVSQPTWVVIYENRNGVPGNALGAALFTAERQSGAVELLRGTLPGTSYLAGEALDDGDHKFSLAGDKPVRDSGGNPVWVQFQTR